MNFGGFFKGKDAENPDKPITNSPSAIPALQQVLSAARGATDAFSGAGTHLNNSLRRFGVKSVEAGIGCGVGVGHGFGVGLAAKPGVVQKIQSGFVQTMAKMMMKLGIVPGLSGVQSVIPGSLQGGLQMITSERNVQTQIGNILQLGSKTTESASKMVPSGTAIGSRSEKVISSFLQNPILKIKEETERNELAGQLLSENNVLQMLLKHQKVIEELMEENEKLRRVLVEDLKVLPSKLEVSNDSRTKFSNPCSDCFECQRRRRKPAR
ncbi:dynamin isoform X2 [Tasmannia lanceolata]|uniref:dynamin isoform X2 n=1 Tax=Tasmannia lanceolata TaxID=3420 RepID=UPI004063DAB6